MGRRKGPPSRNPITRDVHRAERDLSRVARALHITREFVIRCLEALTVEFCVLCIIRFSLLTGAGGLAMIFTR